MKRFIAFTLAETLIVMGVIGIVSALTLPNLNSSTGDKERVAKVKKIYQNLNDAFTRAEAVYGPYSDWFINDSAEGAKAKRIGERMTEFMKLQKSCAMAAGQGCITGDDDNVTIVYKAITADGTSIFIKDNGAIRVDIDGPAKGSYTSGIDSFDFDINAEKGFIPSGYDETFSNLIGSSRNLYAATWIIKYDNADYLKFTDNNGTCPNGTTVTESNPRCK